MFSIIILNIVIGFLISFLIYFSINRIVIYKGPNSRDIIKKIYYDKITNQYYRLVPEEC